MQNHKWTLSDIESLIPWERDIYIAQLMQWIEEEEKRLKS
jgi:hypothetical protein